MDGEQATIHFSNGYGVSVIRGLYSYGGEQGLYELAVLKGGHLCYETPVANDVLGYLSVAEVNGYMRQVQLLEGGTDA